MPGWDFSADDDVVSGFPLHSHPAQHTRTEKIYFNRQIEARRPLAAIISNRVALIVPTQHSLAWRSIPTHRYSRI